MSKRLNSIKTGLLFGSFNPIHNGHLILANYMRLALVRMAIEDNNNIKVSNIEFKMPKPSFTIDTLAWLQDSNSDRQFILICGTDIFKNFHKWKNYNEILNQYSIYTYPRPGFTLGKYSDNTSIKLYNAPLMEISSSFIREGIKKGKNMEFWMPAKVYKYMKEMHFYEK